jgi:hypothetical protein
MSRMLQLAQPNLGPNAGRPTSAVAVHQGGGLHVQARRVAAIVPVEPPIIVLPSRSFTVGESPPLYGFRYPGIGALVPVTVQGFIVQRVAAYPDTGRVLVNLEGDAQLMDPNTDEPLPSFTLFVNLGSTLLTWNGYRYRTIDQPFADSMQSHLGDLIEIDGVEVV